MTQEEKAKRYDEAIKVAKSNYETIVQMDNDCTFAKEGIVNTFHHIFPELKEPEDNRIRKEFCEDIWTFIPNEKAHKYIAWLEKQNQVKESQIFQHENKTCEENDDSLTWEDEDIIKEIISIVKSYRENCITEGNHRFENCLAWLKKQREYKSIQNEEDEKIRDEICIYIGAKQDISLDVHNRWLSWLEKQAEQKSSTEVEPKFKVGDIIRLKDGDGLEWTVEKVLNNGYYTIVCADRDDFIQLDDKWELVGQNPAWSEEDEELRIASIGYLCNLRDSFEAQKWDKKPVQRCINWLLSFKQRIGG